VPKDIKIIGVLTSGGDAPGMNAAVRAVVRACEYNKIGCYGIYQGYHGLINENITKMSARSVKNIINKGGTILKSARCNEFRTKEGRQKAFKTIEKNKIDALIVIGGNGSLEGASIFQKEYSIPFIGIPGTIDNDLMGTRCTVGYDTALNTVIEATDKIRDTAISHNRLFFVEVMGKGTGHIALNTGIGSGAEEILIPEQNMGIERLLDSLSKSEKSGKTSSIIIVTEGEKIGKNVFKYASYIEKNLPEYEVRVTVLGHIQRGGSPTSFDRVLASRMGVYAVDCILNGLSNVMIGIKDDEMIYIQVDKAIKSRGEISKDLIRVFDIISI
jgi:6-phosphofructokinase 1|tara:strand:- start:33 stop:1019 length:987 start_codon:yes stop_codon:yes gene_type:complete